MQKILIEEEKVDYRQGWFRRDFDPAPALLRPSAVAPCPFPGPSVGRAPQSPSECGIQNLLDDVLMAVFANLLRVEDFSVLVRVCHLWNEVADDPSLWRKRWLQRWNLAILSEDSHRTTGRKCYPRCACWAIF